MKDDHLMLDHQTVDLLPVGEHPRVALARRDISRRYYWEKPLGLRLGIVTFDCLLIFSFFSGEYMNRMGNINIC